MIERNLPISYFSAAEKAKILADYHGDIECLYLLECEKARKAEDFDNYWAWNSKIKHSTKNLKLFKRWKGAAFIKEMGFDTSNADNALGRDWLDT